MTQAAEKEREKEKPARVDEPNTFTIEFGNENNQMLAVSVFKEKYRGWWRLSNLRSDVGSRITKMPNIPGQRMAVDIKNMKVEVFDPLEDDPALLAQIDAAMSHQDLKLKSREGKLEPVPRVKKTVTPDQMVTLLMDLKRKLNRGYCEIVSGKFPSHEQIKSVRGREIYDPWNSSHYKPRYKDESYEHFKEMDGRFGN